LWRQRRVAFNRRRIELRTLSAPSATLYQPLGFALAPGDCSPSSQSCSSVNASQAASIRLKRLKAGSPSAASAICEHSRHSADRGRTVSSDIAFRLASLDRDAQPLRCPQNGFGCPSVFLAIEFRSMIFAISTSARSDAKDRP
jgi:hypothetical protein